MPPLGSLSKEFPLHQVEQTIGLARGGMSYREFLRQARAVTHSDIPGIVIRRFLLERQGTILRDRFLSLAETEGLGTPRMRKVMYGTWVLRDHRVRQFILEIIADASGHWRPSEVIRKSNSAFFEAYLSSSTVAKVRSNIEYFLTEAGIYDKGTRTVHLELEDGWLSDAVCIAAEHEPNLEVRRNMATDPLGFIIASGFNGIANASIEEIRGAPPTIQPDAESVDDAELAISPEVQLRARNWKRSAPTTADRQIIQVQVDSVARERASQAHYQLERLLAARAVAAGLRPQFNTHIDLFFQTALGTVLAEIKSCHNNNIHSQIRRGVAQLLEYEFVYHESLKTPIQKLLVLEMAVPVEQQWLVAFLDSIGIAVVWLSAGGDTLETTLTLPEHLAQILVGSSSSVYPHHMDYVAFFAGFQAFAAFLQVWQGERSWNRATEAYNAAKRDALQSPAVREKADRLQAKLSENPTFEKLFRNRLGRCEDEFEGAFRSRAEDELNDAANEFKRCKCLILQAIQTADGLDADLAAEWGRLECEVVLNKR